MHSLGFLGLFIDITLEKGEVVIALEKEGIVVALEKGGVVIALEKARRRIEVGVY